MKTPKIGISVGKFFTAPVAELAKAIAEAGFDAVSPAWTEDRRTADFIAEACKNGLLLQSLHAPGAAADKLWYTEAEISAPALALLCQCVDDCAKWEIPIMVVHSSQHFDTSRVPTEAGFRNFTALVDYAASKNIRIAFENMEREIFIFALMEHFQTRPNVGFCWDSGHELCYNRSMPLLEHFGQKLIMTHINDNLGIRNADGSICAGDDLHLLPFDGVADWDLNLQRLRDAQQVDLLNFEVKPVSHPGQHENDRYAQMPLREFLAEVYARGKKIADAYSLDI